MISEPSSVSAERSVIEMPKPAIDLHGGRVRREARQHLAGARDLEEGRVHANDARVHRVAEVGDDALAEPHDEIEPQRRKRAEHDGGREKCDEVAIDRCSVA